MSCMLRRRGFNVMHSLQIKLGCYFRLVLHMVAEEIMMRNALGSSILTWHGDHIDHEGCVSTARPIHCTPSGLTRTTTPNRGGSSAQFLLVGPSVRAGPFLKERKIVNLSDHFPILCNILFFCVNMCLYFM